jgi:adenosylcobinamide-GDP ribazoletransferase
VVCRRGVPAARPDGLGRTVAGTVTPLPGALAGLVAVAVVLLGAHLAGRPWAQGLVAAALALAAVAALVAHVVRRLGGVSGDVMGAAVEVALTALLVGVVAR